MGYHVQCAYCEKSHSGEQIYNNELQDYVCYECDEELTKQKEKK
jgi:transposase-like protein